MVIPLKTKIIKTRKLVLGLGMAGVTVGKNVPRIQLPKIITGMNHSRLEEVVVEEEISNEEAEVLVEEALAEDEANTIIITMGPRVEVFPTKVKAAMVKEEEVPTSIDNKI